MAKVFGDNKSENIDNNKLNILKQQLNTIQRNVFKNTGKSADKYYNNKNRTDSIKMIIMKLWPLVVVITYQLIAQTAGKFEDYKDVTPIDTEIEFSETPQPQTYVKLNINKHDIKTAIDFSKDGINRLAGLERNLIAANIQIDDNTMPAYGQYIDDSHITPSSQQEDIFEEGKNANILFKAGQYLYNTKCYNHGALKCFQAINHDPELSSAICENMKSTPIRSEQPARCKSKIYRTFDGSCNNLKNTLTGKALTGYKRLLPPNYLDGIEEPRRSVTKKKLTNPREVSLTISSEYSMTPIDRTKTLVFPLWGEFVEHDLAHTISRHMLSNDKPIQCCDNTDFLLSPRHLHPDCMHIEISEQDPVYARYAIACMRYVRSQITTNQQCVFNHINQMNEATHFLDGSQIYGNTEEKAQKLRELKDGRLKTSIHNENEHLQLSTEADVDCQQGTKSDICFVGGDPRINYHPQLTTMYTIWTREHNRIAHILKTLNPTWSDEQLYQETRRIVIAEIQHVTYNEWLPLLVGPNYQFESNKHSANIDPSVTNSFATAVLRFLHSMIDGSIRLSDESRNVVKTLNISDYFNRPQIVVEDGYFDNIVRGFTSNQSPKSDLYFTPELTTKLFKGTFYGYDVLALDIQRGRDHGLPSYNQYRELCGLPKVTKFNQLYDTIHPQIVKSLEKVYLHPDDVDLLIGLLAETTIKNRQTNMILGPTGVCLLKDQMKRTQAGDRYFYTNKLQPKPFTKQQLNEIEKVTLARVLCDNSEQVQSMQRNVFEVISTENPLVSCTNLKKLPQMNLSAWSS